MSNPAPTGKSKTIKCCGEFVSIFEGLKFNESAGCGVKCLVCDNYAVAGNQAEAESEFIPNEIIKPVVKQETKPARQPQKKQENKKMENVPAVSRSGVMDLFKNKAHLIEIVSPIVDQNTGAMERLITKNLRYVENLKGKGYDRLWETEHGRSAIIRETEEAFMMGLEMGKLGDIVPFGDDCTWIPSIEGIELALTFGNNAPFEWILIEIEYWGDMVTSGRTKGNYFVDFDSFGDERQAVKKIHVYGKSKKSRMIEGEAYDSVRLLQKAALHSPPYKNYLKTVRAYEFAKSEGRVMTDQNGRESFIYYTIKDTSTDKYFQKSVDNFYAQESAGKLKKDSKGEYSVEVLPKSGGETWEKKLYRYELEGGKEEKLIFLDELENPYAGADGPEMLRKAGGKSFCNRFLKVRNSEAAMNEAHTHEDIRDRALDMGNDTLNGESEEV